MNHESACWFIGPIYLFLKTAIGPLLVVRPALRFTIMKNKQSVVELEALSKTYGFGMIL